MRIELSDKDSTLYIVAAGELAQERTERILSLSLPLGTAQHQTEHISDQAIWKPHAIVPLFLTITLPRSGRNSSNNMESAQPRRACSALLRRENWR